MGWTNANWRSSGRRLAISETLYRWRPFLRNHRTRLRSGGATHVEVKYSRSHCLTSIPRDTVMRLNTRAANHRAFTQIEPVVGAKLGKMGATSLGFKDPAPLPRLASCWEICKSTWMVTSAGSCCNSLHASIMNAVRIAENKPAYESFGLSGS